MTEQQGSLVLVLGLMLRRSRWPVVALTVSGRAKDLTVIVSPAGPVHLGPDGKPSGKYADEVDKLTQYSKQLDDFRKTTAEYWEDGPGTVTPPGHWNQFAQRVARRDAHSADRDARMFFALNNALLDASICAWDGKDHWDSVRPITAIRWLDRGKIIQAWGGPYKGPSYIRGEEWIPYRPPGDPSPPVAEYASGHSTFSMAAAEVLTAFTGRGNFELEVTIPAGSSKVEPRTDTQPGVPAGPITLWIGVVAGQKRQADAGRDDSRPLGHDAQQREDIEPGLVAARSDGTRRLLDQVNASNQALSPPVATAPDACWIR